MVLHNEVFQKFDKYGIRLVYSAVYMIPIKTKTVLVYLTAITGTKFRRYLFSSFEARIVRQT